MKKALLFIFAAVWLVLMGACQQDKISPKDYDDTGDCTVLVYMVAENSLYSDIYNNMNDMLRAAPQLKKGQRMVLYVDDRSYPRMYIINNKSNARHFDPVFEFTEDFNSASPETLKMIIEYTRRLCPAREYAYIFWSHGSGWIPQEDSQKAQTRSFGVDNQLNTGGNQGFHMNISDLADALRPYGKARFVLFDACFMQTIECAYELRDVTDYIIASPAEIPAHGAPYALQLPHYFADPFVPDSLSYDYWYWYKNFSDMGIATSVIKSDELEQLAEVTRRFINIDSLKNKNVAPLLNYFQYDAWNWLSKYPDAVDMRAIMKSELSASDYEIWMEALRKAVPAAYCTGTWYSAYNNCDNRIDTTQYSGVSMYIPRTTYRQHHEFFYSEYYKTQWYNAIKVQ